jgi:predicted RNA-binding protein with RPS1 domain
MGLKNTIAVSGEIDGKEYGCFLELEDEETTVEYVVEVIQAFIDRLEKVEQEKMKI